MTVATLAYYTQIAQQKCAAQQITCTFQPHTLQVHY
jgi:hypothetical protein